MRRKGNTAPKKTSIYGLVCLSGGIMMLAAGPGFGQDATEQAVEKPAAKVAAQSEDKTEKAEDKAEQPAEKPVETPAEKPAEVLPEVTFVKPAGDAAAAAEEPSGDELEVQEAIKAFAHAFNAHDAKAVAGCFTSLAELQNQTGHITRGNEPIHQAFTKLFADHPKVRLQLEIHSIRFLSPDLVVEEGFSTMTGGGAEGEHSAPHIDRYTITHIRQDKVWLVASARDWPPPAPTAEQQLQQLGWLVGDWVDENSSTTVHTSYHWSNDKRYLLSRYSVQREGRPPVEGLQRIGWDPQTRQLHSWIFDSTGGFSQGLWSRAGDQWVVKMTGVMADGQIRSATNILTRLSPDHATYQSRDRAVGGELLPDMEAVPIVRKPPEPKLMKQ